ncbi:hypothetical protein TNCV_4466731 [Trichonephila clavipes]|nr:hypothetical protein TNCV_4466731 [Trichonephila clavipes]
MIDKVILEIVQSSKNIIDTDSDSEDEVNKAPPIPTSSEMRNIMTSVFADLLIYHLQQRSSNSVERPLGGRDNSTREARAY